jgi:peptidoglycan/LPS O-acetylase OafA/YrhL
MPQLDLLRGIAILMVLGSHPVVKLDEAGLFLPLASIWSYVGWTGVNLFFVLSGFLVGGLLLAELQTTGKVNARRFMVRRMFKIWPSYYAYLIVMILVLTRVGVDLRILFPFFFHVQNYSNEIDVIAPHTWSLAVEEHFYLLLPILLAVVRSAGVWGLLGMACFLGCALSRGMSHVALPTVATHHNLDSLAFGVLLAYAYHFRPHEFKRFSGRPLLLVPAGLSLIVLGLTPRVHGSPAAGVVVPILLYLGYGMILAAMIALPINHGAAEWFFRSMPARCLLFVGIYSYSVYLWHIDIAYRLVDVLIKAEILGGTNPSIRWAVLMSTYVAIAVGAGALFGRCIEMPALHLRDRLFPRQESSLRERTGLFPQQRVPSIPLVTPKSD